MLLSTLSISTEGFPVVEAMDSGNASVAPTAIEAGIRSRLWWVRGLRSWRCRLLL